MLLHITDGLTMAILKINCAEVILLAEVIFGIHSMQYSCFCLFEHKFEVANDEQNVMSVKQSNHFIQLSLITFISASVFLCNIKSSQVIL